MFSSLVKDACDIFSNKYRTHLPDEVNGCCEHFSLLFQAENPQFSGKPLHLLGHRSCFPNRHHNYNDNGYPNPDKNFYHVMVYLDDNHIVDVTNKQLDTEGPPYRILNKEEVIAEWLVVADDWDIIETILDASELASVPGREYYVKNCHVELRECIDSGVLILTGTENDNPWLEMLNKETTGIG